MGTAFCCICNVHKGGVHFSEEASGLVCRACYRREFAPREACSVCKIVKLIGARPNGVVYCEACYKRVLLVAVCGYCKKRRRLHARDARRRPVCLPCYQRHLAPREPCLFCEKLMVAVMRGAEGECICQACWQREMRPAEPCIRCGAKRFVAKRAADGAAICEPCRFAESPPGRCRYCRQLRPVRRGADGRAVCVTCWPKHVAKKRACADCGRLDQVIAWRTKNEPLCRNCYRTTEQPREACAECGKHRPVAAHREDGSAVCDTCYARLRHARSRGPLGEPTT